jgi:predicted patatin/cPLA2 family phospholipase
MSPPQTKSEAPQRRTTALIVEGGAMRGAWAAGVLAFLHERGRRQYDLVYAASSGACSAAYFVAGMFEPGLNIWRELACKAVRKINLLRHQPVIDLAYLVDHVFRKHVPLSIEALQKAPTRFYIVLTDCHTGEPVYFHAHDERVFAALRATSSMPLATRGYDYVDGHPYADGGIADSIPIKRAIQDGATDITVVLTHNHGLRLKPLPRWLGRLAYPEFPRVAEVWTTRQCITCNAALELMKQPPPGIRLQVFHPVKPVPIGCFTTARKRIEAAVIRGHDDALEQLAAFAPEPEMEPEMEPAIIPVRE